MKHTRLPRTGLLLSALLLTTCPLTACLPSTPPTEPPTTESSSNAPDSPSQPSDSALRAYYEALIADLNQALLDAKQDDYITQKEYEARIAELESRIEALSRPSEPPDEATDLPVSTIPTPPAETTPPTQIPPTSAFTYTEEQGSITIRAYRGEERRVTVPSSIGGLPVTRIADDAFRATAVTAVTVPKTVTEIGWFAFADCPHLQAVTLPASVTVIGYGAFDGSPHVTVLCPPGSYAMAYAQSFALRVSESEG